MATDRQLRYLRNRFRLTLLLGGLYNIDGKLYRFIKVTDKGFNFLDEATNKCILKHHLYSRKHYGIPLPADIKHIHVMMPGRYRPNYMGVAYDRTTTKAV
jgi:hypothetical protein